MRRSALFLLVALIALSASLVAVTAGKRPGVLFLAVLLGLLAAMVAWTMARHVRFHHVD